MPLNCPTCQESSLSLPLPPSVITALAGDLNRWLKYHCSEQMQVSSLQIWNRQNNFVGTWVSNYKFWTSSDPEGPLRIPRERIVLGFDLPRLGSMFWRLPPEEDCEMIKLVSLASFFFFIFFLLKFSNPELTIIPLHPGKKKRGSNNFTHITVLGLTATSHRRLSGVRRNFSHYWLWDSGQRAWPSVPQFPYL